MQLQTWQAILGMALGVGGVIATAGALAFRLGRKAGTLETEKRSFESTVTAAIEKLTEALNGLIDRHDEDRREAAHRLGEWTEWRNGVDDFRGDHEQRMRVVEGRPITEGGR